MRVILSRKGFDSTAGGFPSLIFPDGTLFSIPIPSSNDRLTYTDLPFEYEGEPIHQVLNDITNKRIVNSKSYDCDYSAGRQRCHFDPMPISVDGKDMIALGQVGSSEGHLRNQGVCIGDLFLFYGWYKPVIKVEGKWQYDYSQNDVHQVWACMTIGERLEIDKYEQEVEVLNRYPWLTCHPHIGDKDVSRNCIYLSKKGRFFSYSDKRCLTDTKNYQGRSIWRLPRCFNQPQAFSYLKNFSLDGEDVVVSYRGYGQEFVLDLDKVTLDEERESIVNYLAEIQVE
ncbi:MAG: hypothetical protein M0P11_03310 [Anaerolineaceae bacterium]|jgi:hypothetical protein|nr:hypothetical protein [Anaerolineaceae bacterium]